jgi:hypothetical protein
MGQLFPRLTPSITGSNYSSTGNAIDTSTHIEYPLTLETRQTGVLANVNMGGGALTVSVARLGNNN